MIFKNENPKKKIHRDITIHEIHILRIYLIFTITEIFCLYILKMITRLITRIAPIPSEYF